MPQLSFPDSPAGVPTLVRPSPVELHRNASCVGWGGDHITPVNALCALEDDRIGVVDVIGSVVDLGVEHETSVAIAILDEKLLGTGITRKGALERVNALVRKTYAAVEPWLRRRRLNANDLGQPPHVA